MPERREGEREKENNNKKWRPDGTRRMLCDSTSNAQKAEVVDDESKTK